MEVFGLGRGMRSLNALGLYAFIAQWHYYSAKSTTYPSLMYIYTHKGCFNLYMKFLCASKPVVCPHTILTHITTHFNDCSAYISSYHTHRITHQASTTPLNSFPSDPLQPEITNNINETVFFSYGQNHQALPCCQQFTAPNRAQ